MNWAMMAPMAQELADKIGGRIYDSGYVDANALRELAFEMAH